jgi:hypothetical protein
MDTFIFAIKPAFRRSKHSVEKAISLEKANSYA